MRRTLLAWTVETDPEATRSAYRAAESGAARRCGCAPCRNFDLTRPQHFSPPLRDFLEAVAVDPHKEASVALVTPLEDGLNLYSGSYVFCGEILTGRPRRGFPFLTERVDVYEQLHPRAHVTLRCHPSPAGPWQGLRCVRLEFLVVLPWVLPEDRAEAIDLDRGPGSFMV